MNKEQRAYMRKLAEEATPGPWYQVGLPWNQKGDFVCAGSEDPHIWKYVADTEDFDGEVDNSFANAAHIAAANPSAILQLLDYIDTLENDAARLDFIEQEAMLSRTGISFDYARITEDGYVVERGWRMCKWHSLGERKTSIRNAIDAAMQGETE